MATQQTKKILVVDDESFNRDLLSEMLTTDGYTVDMAENGEEAWFKLNNEPMEYSAVLLDRMMPRMDGMALLARIKESKVYRSLPVILQTAVDTPHDIAEGIAAGAYYYLVKPINAGVLSAIVKSAVTDFASLNKEAGVEQLHEGGLAGVIQRAEFRLSKLSEARSLAMIMSSFYPQPRRVFVGILELLINAVEHGNLGISYEEKSKLLRESKWEDEIVRRAAMPAYADKVVDVLLENTSTEIKLIITDQGEGFDSSQYMEISPERAFDPNGRGIAMSKMMSFDSIQFKGRGNQVIAVVKL